MNSASLLSPTNSSTAPTNSLTFSSLDESSGSSDVSKSFSIPLSTIKYSVNSFGVLVNNAFLKLYMISTNGFTFLARPGA